MTWSDVSSTQCNASLPAGGSASISSTADIAMLDAPCSRTHGVVERGRGIEIATKRTSTSAVRPTWPGCGLTVTFFLQHTSDSLSRASFCVRLSPSGASWR